MDEIEGIVLLLIVAWALISSAKNTAKQRARIKERANHEYDGETEISADELESRLDDAEIMYEDLEQTYWVHVSVLIGLCTYFYWHIWYVSLGLGMGLAYIGCKFLSVKPFSTAVPDR